jgi:hypothetical protein
VVRVEDGEKAVKAVHEKFELSREQVTEDKDKS